MKYNKNEVTGKMRDRIILQNVNRSRSLTGFASESWADTATIWAFAESKLPGSNETIIDGKNTAKNVCDFTIRYISTISEESRVVWGDKLYQVKNLKVSHDRRFISFQGVFYDSYILRGVNVDASVNGIGTTSANLKLIMSVIGQANASASTTATITKIIEVSSLVNANASLSGDINFVQKAQASLLATGTTTADLTAGPSVISIDYLVVAGGGGSGNFNSWNAGGGAGGYRCNVIGESSGGGSSAESSLILPLGSYILTVGSGGSPGSQGSISKFHLIESIGGGYGGQAAIGALATGGNGGSGGGGSANNFFGGLGTVNQGFSGGQGSSSNNGGGGGAGGLGGTAVGATPGIGGIGVTSNINGTVIRGIGGSGGTINSNGLVNTGNGGSGNSGGSGKGSGGSGIVVLKIPDTITATFSAGVTQTTLISGGFKIITVTAAGVSDTVTFS